MRGKQWRIGAAVALTSVVSVMRPVAVAAQQVPAGPPVLPPALNPDRINAEERRRLEQRTAPLPESGGRLVAPPPPAAPAAADASAVRFTLTAVEFDPSAYLSAAELAALAKPLIGTSVAVADLRGLIDRINALYQQRGFVTARAALPVQDIKDGVVAIRLIEGRIGKLGAEGGLGAQPAARRRPHRAGDR